MEISREGLDLIKHFEGLAKLRKDGKVEAYLCPANVPTIGYGSTGNDIKLGLIWTRQQCEDRLHYDVKAFEQGVTKLAGVHGGQHRHDALVSFAYNLGLDALRRSTLLRKHNEGDYAGAELEFGKWVFAGGKRLSGLVKRRAAEAALYGKD